MRLTIPALLAITGPVVFWLLVRYQFDSNTPFMGLVALERFDVLLAMGALTVFVIASSAPAARSWPSLMARSLLFLWSVAVVLVGLWVVLYAE
ncbi:MAG: hypothetical protein QOJ16_710 [Acidobacteriota bacterium]|nr:hypothetical protein [Acidobacteriota bacterium]